MIWTALTLILLILWSVAVAIAWASLRSLPIVQPEPPDPNLSLPRLSVIVPARDEAETISRCLESLLAQDHPDFEIIAIDDRSTDGTGALMDEIAARSEGRVKAIHIQDLPEGWIGKCHAIQRGVEQATGERLLFTDGDVIFEPQALRTASQMAERDHVDHLMLVPDLELHSAAERIATVNHTLSFLVICPPVLVSNPRSPVAMGIGAFNLVRRDLYERTGGHEKLRLHVIDDLALGMMLKAHGARVRVGRGQDLIRVRWQHSALELVTGLEKNAFAATGYRLSVVVMLLALQVVAVWGPWAGLFFGSALARSACLVTVLALQPLLGIIAARTVRVSIRYAPLTVIGTLFNTATLINSAVRTLMRGGVQWRGTVYPLSLLREFRRDFRRDLRAAWKRR